MKHVYIILTNTNTKVSKFLRLFTGDEYNHVSIALSGDCSEMYSFARWIDWCPWIAGFARENVDEGVLAHHPETKCIIYDLEVSNKDYLVILKRLNKFLRNPRKYRYSFISIPLMFFNIPYERKDLYVCSTFVSYILRDIVDIDKNFTLIKPSDYSNLQLNSVYEGKLRDFVYYNKKAI